MIMSNFSCLLHNIIRMLGVPGFQGDDACYSGPHPHQALCWVFSLEGEMEGVRRDQGIRRKVLRAWTRNNNIHVQSCDATGF